MMGACEIAQSLMAQRLQKLKGSLARAELGSTHFSADSLAHAGVRRENLLATQEVAWAKAPTLPSPREIAWSRCKSKSQNAIEQ
jgi:hypothetical protein